MTHNQAPEPSDQVAPKTLAAWQFVQQMLADVTRS